MILVKLQVSTIIKKIIVSVTIPNQKTSINLGNLYIGD